jgi:hypothetical protein
LERVQTSLLVVQYSTAAYTTFRFSHNLVDRQEFDHKQRMNSSDYASSN